MYSAIGESSIPEQSFHQKEGFIQIFKEALGDIGSKEMKLNLRSFYTMKREAQY